MDCCNSQSLGEHLREEITASEIVYAGRVLTVRLDTVRLPDGTMSIREVIVHPGAVAIVPMLDETHVLFVRQWRNAAGGALLEIPAGGMEAGETPEECAVRELMEEIGYRPRKLLPLQSIYLAPGYSSELLRLFLATDLAPERRPHDVDERLEVVTLCWEEIDGCLRRGEFRDAKTISALLLAQRTLQGSDK